MKCPLTKTRLNFLICLVLVLVLFIGGRQAYGQTQSGRISRGLTLSTEERSWLKKHPEIVIAFDGDFAPFSSLTPEKVFVGYAVDVVDLISQRTGIKFRVHPDGVWKSLYESAQNKEVDVVAEMTPREDRKEWFSFTEPYIFQSSYIFTKTMDDRIHAPDDVHGFRVSMVDGYNVNKSILADFPDIIPVYVKDTTEALNAIIDNRADLHIGSRAIVEHLIRQHALDNLHAVSLWRKDVSINAFGVRKDWPELVSILNKTLASFSNKEWIALRNKWLYSSSGEAVDSPEMTLNLTAEEREWLKKHPVIRLGDDFAWPPFVFKNEKGKFLGIASSYLEIISKELLIDVQPIMGLTWEQVLDGIKNQRIDIMPAVVQTPERESYMRFTKPYITSPIIVATRKQYKYIDDLNDLTGKRVGTVKGFVTESYLTRDHPSFKLIIFPSVLMGLEALNNGYLDAFVGNLGVVTYEIEHNDFDQLKIAAPTPYAMDLSIGVRKDWPELVSVLDKALDSIGEYERTTIENRWMSVTVYFGTRLSTIVRWAVPVAIGIFLIFGLILYWNRRMDREIKERKLLETELVVARQKAEQANQAKSEFLANISHELRNPMHQILSYSKYGVDKIDKPKEKLWHYFNSTRKAAEKLMVLLNALLDLSKMESGKMDYNMELNNAYQIVNEIVSELYPALEEKNLSIEIKDPGVPTKVVCDFYKLSQVVRNLLSNAIKFTPENKCIEVDFALHQLKNGNGITPSLKISIRDQGVGIPENEVDFVFNKFTQSSKTKTGAGGTGLGLAICLEIIKAHGGKIWAENNSGAGAVFNIVIPYT